MGYELQRWALTEQHPCLTQRTRLVLAAICKASLRTASRHSSYLAITTSCYQDRLESLRKCSRCGALNNRPGPDRICRCGVRGLRLDHDPKARRIDNNAFVIHDVEGIFDSGCLDQEHSETERLGSVLMLAYPITLEEDGYALIATSPDFPELTIVGVEREETLARVVEALEEAIADRIHRQEDVPEPSEGDILAILPTLTSVKVMLYQEMREQGITRVELSRRLGWHLPQVFRVLDLKTGSHMDKMDAALGAVGKKLYVTAAEAPESLVESAGQGKEAAA